MKHEPRFCVDCKHHSQDTPHSGFRVTHKCNQSLGTRNMITGRFKHHDCRVVRETLCLGRWFAPKSRSTPKKLGWFKGLISQMSS